MANRVVKAVACVLGAAVLAGGVCAAGYGSRDNETGKWFKNGNIPTWFNSWGKDKPQEEESEGKPATENTGVMDDEGNFLDSNQTYAMPRSLTFMSTRATSTPSVTVKATITPANADDKRVVWNSSNPQLVTVTPSSTDPLAATITCNEVLTEVVYVSCTSVDNGAASAVCQVDYLTPAANVKLSANISGEPQTLSWGKTYSLDLSLSPDDSGYGTIMGGIDSINGYVRLTNNFKKTVCNYLDNYGYNDDSGYDFMSDAYDIEFENTSFKMSADPSTAFYGSVPKDVFNNCFKLAMRDLTTHAEIYVYANYVYNGEVYSRLVTTVENISFSLSEIWVSVSGVSIDNNVIFGT